MRALATIALGLSGILVDRSILHLRVIVESIVLRLALVLVCAVTALAAGGFFLAVIYDLSAAAWGGIAAKVMLGSLLACVALVMGLLIARAGTQTARWMRRM